MILVLFILLAAFFNVAMIYQLEGNPDYYQLDAYTWETDDFRSMKLGELLTDEAQWDYEQITTLMLQNSFDLTKLSQGDYHSQGITDRKPVQYQKLKKAYETVLKDLVYFPIPRSTDDTVPDVAYENGWQDRRTYGSERYHEGCDIMGVEKPRGYYPVVSMSDGVIEKIGWLEQGGWRIGIRAPSGSYLYYAHLYGYAKDLAEGDTVKAGQLLGFMGDSGYGKEEGTVGNFDVHLHIGIYIKTDHYEEMSVNPYWILRYLEKNRQKAAY